MRTSSAARTCPWYASRDLAKTCNVVFAPYQYLVDPSARASAGLALKGAIVVFDEAHNVTEAAEEGSSSELTDVQLLDIAAQVIGLVATVRAGFLVWMVLVD